MTWLSFLKLTLFVNNNRYLVEYDSELDMFINMIAKQLASLRSEGVATSAAASNSESRSRFLDKREEGGAGGDEILAEIGGLSMSGGGGEHERRAIKQRRASAFDTKCDVPGNI